MEASRKQLPERCRQFKDRRAGDWSGKRRRARYYIGINGHGKERLFQGGSLACSKGGGPSAGVELENRDDQGQVGLRHARSRGIIRAKESSAGRGVFYLLLLSTALMEWCHAAGRAGWVGRERQRVRRSCGRRNRAFSFFSPRVASLPTKLLYPRDCACSASRPSRPVLPNQLRIPAISV